MATTYAQDQVQSAPAWLQGPVGAAFLSALGAQKDWIVSAAMQAVKARMPGYGGAPLAATNALLGVGDGATTFFPLPGLAAGAPSVFVAGDWQGYRQLYPTARTNVLKYSADFTQSAAWVPLYGGTGVAPIITGNYGTAPDGTATADRIQLNKGAGTTNADYSRMSQGYTATAGATYVGSVWLRSTDGASTYQVAVETVSGTGGYRVITVTGTWQRFSGIVWTAPGSGPQNCLVSLRGSYTPETSQSVDILAWGAQLEAVPSTATAPTGYVPTVASAVTVTDYALVAQGAVSTSSPPATDAQLTWSGSYLRPLSPPDALALIGQERGIDRGLVEAEAGYRSRLQAAFALWQWAGTPYGILSALYAAGYPNPVLQTQSGQQFSLNGYTGNASADLIISALPPPVHLGGSPAELWSDFALLIMQPWPSWWSGTAPADGSADQKTVAALVSRWKPAHARCVQLKVIQGPTVGVNITVGASFTVGGGTIVAWTSPVG